MSQEQYTAIARTRLIDVHLLSESDLIQYLSLNSEWAIQPILRWIRKQQ